MQHVLETSKRVFSAAIAAATIAFSVGAAGVISPLTAKAASGGDLIKGTSLSTVYYMGYDGMRYAFPNEKTYFSWYANFNGVTTISDSELAGITLGGNVVVRPGTHFIKVTSDPKVYAVGRDGTIHWIESEDVAIDLAGSDWASNAIDVPDVFFDDYTVGTSLMTATAFEGAVFEMGGTTYVSWDGEMRELTSAGMSANNIWDKFVLDGSGIDDSALAMGSEVTSDFLALVDSAQTEDGEGSSTSGDLTVSNTSSTPAGTSLTGGANAVEVFSFNVEAGAEDATLDSVVLDMTGAGSTSNISAVYLYEGNTRLTESRTVNSSTRAVTFSNIGLDIDAGDEVTLTVRVTVSTSQTAADTFGFKIADADSVTGSGDVDGNFPVSGNLFTLTGSDSGTVTVTKSGSITNPTLGEQDAEIGEFKVAASGTEGASIEMLTLKIDNSADHSDFKLWDGTEMIANGDNTTGDLVVFDLSSDAFAIEEGSSNIFTVTADIGGQASDAVKVFIDNAVDLVAVGTDYGFGMAVDTGSTGTYDGTSCTSTSGKCSYSTVQGGELTIAFNGPTAGDVQIDATAQNLLEFSITAAQDVTIKDLDIQVAADDDNDGDATDGVESGTSDDDGLINTGSEANVKNIKLVNADTGATVMGPLELDTATDNAADATSLTGSAEDALQILDFSDDFAMEAGETLNLKVVADIDNSLTSGETLVAIFDISGLSAEDTNGDALTAGTDIVPNTDITGYNQTARSASLTFALASSPTDVTTVDGANNVTVVGFTATAGDASDVHVTDFILTVYGDDDGAGTSVIGGESGADVNDYIESCSLYEGSTLLDGPEAPVSSGQTINFSNIDWTIDAGAVATLSIKCNVANTSESGTSTFSFDINDSTADVTAEDEDGDPVSASGSDINGATTISSANVVTVADAGSLSVAAGSATPTADFVLTSSADNSVATYRFTATNEAFNVETLTFSEEQAEDDTATGDSSAYANNISLVTISYPKADGTTGTKTAAMSGNEARFTMTGTNAMYVGVGSPADVTVKVDVAGTDRDAGGSATSGEKIRMGLFVDTTGDDNFKAIGVDSGSTLDDDDQGAIGNDAVGTDGIHTFVVKETKPTITLSSSSPSGSAVVGRSEVLRFNVAASANEDVVLNTLTFAISSTDNSAIVGGSWNACDTDQDGTEMKPSDFDLYNLTDDGTTTTLDLSSVATQNSSVTQMAAGTTSPWTILKSTGAICDATEAAAAFVHLTLPASEIIPKGQTKTFALYFDATGASSSADDSIRFDIPTDPIVGTYLSVANASNDGSLAATATTLNVDSGTAFAVGDVIVYDAADDGVGAADERMLITGISTNALTVVRGYMGTQLTATGDVANTDDVFRMPGSMLWKDDGVTGSAGGADDFWGSYLVDNLTLSGNTLVF